MGTVPSKFQHSHFGGTPRCGACLRASRGGGEKGEAWYKAGYKDDQAQHLEGLHFLRGVSGQEGIYQSQKLGGTGTSAGGILISRAITERPDLFAAAICNVGCANAMRLEFSPMARSTRRNLAPLKDPVECQALFEMDGVQHVAKGVKYPA